MIQKTLVVGPFQCNCTILACEKTKEAVIIDAGDEYGRIAEALKAMGVVVRYSLHTHAHLDHIGAVSDLKAATPATKIVLHKDDHELYKNLPVQGGMFGFTYAPPPAVDKFIEDGEVLGFGQHSLRCVHTPGHSPGGICLEIGAGALGDAPVLFTGDTLFKESIGRTDLWGGDFGVLKRSIKDRIYTLPEETVVMPGHGGATTIGFEARNNPFVTV